NMSEWRNFLVALKSNRYDAAVLLVTFLLTVVFDLVIAIEVGMVLAAFLFMKRMSDITDMKPVLGAANGEEHLFDEEVGALPGHVLLFEISGPLFFGAAQKFRDVLGEINDRHRVVVLRMRQVPLVDATGLHRLGGIVKHLQAHRRKVFLVDIDPRVREELIGQDWLRDGMIQPSLAEAIASAE
ncbi:MAG TPA: STAS domain-containing protein, partial [Flavobacteriales bacterium]|nr:STAS domain-containing protein [Flavobacteriales bacterium]